MEMGLFLAILGAALSVILAGIGSVIGVGLAGQASAGVMSEDPEKFGSLLILTALPGTQGIYGFLAGILVFRKIGLIGAVTPSLTVPQGWTIFLACMPVALAGLVSAIHQGRVSTAGVGMVARQPGAAMRAVTMSALVETYAVLGLLASILLLNGIRLG